MRNETLLARPDISALESELKREKYKQRYRRTLQGTLCTLVVVAAIAVLVSSLWLPVLRIFGSSMAPTLQEGEIVVAAKGSAFQPGDVIGFWYGNKLLVKRYIAGPGDWVNITEDGTVFVNNEELEEPYLEETTLGDCNIELPYQVPENRYFVIGDHRASSIDSRNTTVGCIAEEQVVGKIIFRIWPLSELGGLD